MESRAAVAHAARGSAARGVPNRVRAGCAALIALAVALTCNLGRQLGRRHAVRALAAELGAGPALGSLGPTLARALGDPELRIACALPGIGGYVDADGSAVAPPVLARGFSVTALPRNRRPVATIAHSARVDDLERELGSAVRLALENERLHAAVLAQLADLHASRARVVATADAARRRLERDLHDGAQQRLLALGFDLRVAHTAATRAGDSEVAGLLARAAMETRAAIDDLRDVARGIYPAIVAEAGLATALAAFADTAPITRTVAATPMRRHRPEVEAAAYNVVSRGIHDAARRGARAARVSARDDGDRLAISIEHDGSTTATALTLVVDRVAALGGRVVIDHRSLRAEIPCA